MFLNFDYLIQVVFENSITNFTPIELPKFSILWSRSNSCPSIIWANNFRYRSYERPSFCHIKNFFGVIQVHLSKVDWATFTFLLFLGQSFLHRIYIFLFRNKFICAFLHLSKKNLFVNRNAEHSKYTVARNEKNDEKTREDGKKGIWFWMVGVVFMAHFCGPIALQFRSQHLRRLQDAFVRHMVSHSWHDCAFLHSLTYFACAIGDLINRFSERPIRCCGGMLNVWHLSISNRYQFLLSAPRAVLKYCGLRLKPFCKAEYMEANPESIESIFCLYPASGFEDWNTCATTPDTSRTAST